MYTYDIENRDRLFLSDGRICRALPDPAWAVHFFRNCSRQIVKNLTNAALTKIRYC